MKLRISKDIFYINNLYVCHVGAGDGSDDIRSGRYPVTTQFSHAHGDILPQVDGIGWIGADPGCDIVLGRVRSGGGVIPGKPFVDMLLNKIEAAEGMGKSIFLEVY